MEYAVSCMPCPVPVSMSIRQPTETKSGGDNRNSSRCHVLGIKLTSLFRSNFAPPPQYTVRLREFGIPKHSAVKFCSRIRSIANQTK